jgi:hypothetical protein
MAALNLRIPERTRYARDRHFSSGDEKILTYCHACESDYCSCQPGAAVRGEVKIETSEET